MAFGVIGYFHLENMSVTTRKLGMQQPASGILATVLIMGISLAFISLFDYPTFSGWASYLLMCLIPAQIVVSVTWACNHPGFAAAMRQPLKGTSLVLLTVVIGVIVSTVHYKTVGGGIDPPAPMLIMCIILSVITTFWFAIMFGSWPFTSLIKNPVAAGLVMLLGVYLVNFALFHTFFNYEFMRGAPVYAPALDPHGLFNAWSALVFFVTASAVMFLMLNFELWPLTSFPAIMRQPVLGIVWTLIVVVITAILFYLGVDVVWKDPVAFMIRVPIPFIFGTIVTHNMLEGCLFVKLKQPVKGVLNTVGTVIIGTGLAWLYGSLAPHVTGALKSGPPAYDYEIWLASALLAVTFPFLIFYAEFFKMWPLCRVEVAESVSHNSNARAASRKGAAV